MKYSIAATHPANVRNVVWEAAAMSCNTCAVENMP